MKALTLKIVGAGLSMLLVAVMVLLALGKISTLYFWVIILLGAIVAYWVVPRIRRD